MGWLANRRRPKNKATKATGGRRRRGFCLSQVSFQCDQGGEQRTQEEAGYAGWQGRSTSAPDDAPPLPAPLGVPPSLPARVGGADDGHDVASLLMSVSRNSQLDRGGGVNLQDNSQAAVVPGQRDGNGSDTRARCSADVVERGPSRSLQWVPKVVVTGSGSQGSLRLGPNLNGSEGTVVAVDDVQGLHEVQLLSGILIKNLRSDRLVPAAEKDAGGHDGAEQVYAPFSFATMNAVMSQAGRIKSALAQCEAMGPTVPNSAGFFWQAVATKETVYGLTTDLHRLLQAHGYIEAGTKSPLRVDAPKKELQQLASAGGPSHGHLAQICQPLT